MPDPTTDPIRAACEAAATMIVQAVLPPFKYGPDYDTARAAILSDVLPRVESHLRGPLTDRERTALEALDDSPILSKYHGARGFDIERFVEDYEAWKLKARDALRLYDAP